MSKKEGEQVKLFSSKNKWQHEWTRIEEINARGYPQMRLKDPVEEEQMV